MDVVSPTKDLLQILKGHFYRFIGCLLNLMVPFCK
jgi:hypothetical protein